MTTIGQVGTNISVDFTLPPGIGARFMSDRMMRLQVEIRDCEYRLAVLKVERDLLAPALALAQRRSRLETPSEAD